MNIIRITYKCVNREFAQLGKKCYYFYMSLFRIRVKGGVDLNKKYLKVFCVMTILCMMLSCVCGMISPVSVLADEAHAAYIATYNVKQDVTSEELSKFTGKYVELIVKQGETVIGDPVWFKITDAKWKISLKDSPVGAYTINAYSVSEKGEYADTSNPELLVFQKAVTVGDTYATVEAKFDKYKSTTAITTTVKNVVCSTTALRVYVEYYSSKNKVVYTATASENNGVYTARATYGKLNKKVDKYKSVVNIVDANGVCYTLANSATATLKYAKSSVTGKSPDETAGTFLFKTGKIYTAGSLKVSSVSMTVWCKTTDKKTYSGLKKSSDGTYKAKVNVSNHKYHFGTYNVTVKAKLTNGKKVTVAKGTYYFKPANFVRYGKTNSKFEKKITIYNPTVTENVYLDVWSKKGNGEDEVIYPMEKSGSKLIVTVNMKKLKYSGTIYIQLNKKENDEYQKIKKAKFKATSSEIRKHGWYYKKAKDGVTYKFYYKNGKIVKDLTKKLKIKNQKLFIKVNRTMNTVTVYAYDSKKKKWNVPVIAFACSVGLPATPTPVGTFHTDRNHRWKELMGPSWGQYATHIMGGIYFHSVAGGTRSVYNVNAYSYNRLGQAASHGCVRLNVANAKWIYDHAKLGTTVKIYDSNFSGPLGKPKTIKIPASQHYDPTDPAVKK